MKNNLKHFSWTWVVIGLLVVGAIYIIISNTIHEKSSEPQVCIGEKCFIVEIARTSAEQQKGLMNRTSMAEKSGMIFIFPKSDIYNFWMKNTLIPLDMIWMDDTLTVMNILTAQPCISDPCTLYRPGKIAKYVLEINAGIAAKYGIVVGSVMTFRNIE